MMNNVKSEMSARCLMCARLTEGITACVCREFAFRRRHKLTGTRRLWWFARDWHADGCPRASRPRYIIIPVIGGRHWEWASATGSPARSVWCSAYGATHCCDGGDLWLKGIEGKGEGHWVEAKWSLGGQPPRTLLSNVIYLLQTW